MGALWHPLGCENARNQPILVSKIEETINLAVLLSDKKPWSHRGAPWCGFADGTKTESFPQVKGQNLGPEIDRIGQIGSPFHKIQAWLVRTSPIHGDWFAHSLTRKVSTYLDSKSKYQIMGKLLISSKSHMILKNMWKIMYCKSRNPAVSCPFAVAVASPESLLGNPSTRPKWSAAAISFVGPDVLWLNTYIVVVDTVYLL